MSRNKRYKFRVGQRVRFIPTGVLGTVTGPLRLIHFTGEEQNFMGHEICVDGRGSTDANGKQFAAPAKELEPIYDGNQPASWEEIENICGWTPAAP